jgi:hypothetical protein
MECNGVHVSLGLLYRDAGFEASYREQEVEVMVKLLRLEDEGHGKLILAAVGNACRKYSNDGIGFAVDAHSVADDCAIRAQVSP